MNKKTEALNKCKYFYVDESGDLTFFRKGKPANFAADGISKFFIVGAVKLKDNLDTVATAFETLRNDLLVDPFIKKFPPHNISPKCFMQKMTLTL